MEAEQVSKRYARGLFEAAQQKQTSQQVNEDFKSLADICRDDSALIDFLAAPQINDKDKAVVVEKIFKDKVAKELYSLLQLIIQKNRTDYIVAIAEEFEALVLENQGVVKTCLITAIALDESEIAGVKAALEKKTGKIVRIETKVDPAIIGGLIAIIGDKIIDRSVRHDLTVLKDKLMKIKVF